MSKRRIAVSAGDPNDALQHAMPRSRHGAEMRSESGPQRLLRLSLFAVLAMSAATLLTSNPIIVGLLGIAAAAGLSRTAILLPPEATKWLAPLRIPLSALLAVAAFGLLQCLPLAFLAHPIWQSVQPGLASPIWGSISVDVLNTLTGAISIAVVAAAMIVVATVALDRRVARTILHVLVCVAAWVVLLAVLSHVAPDLGLPRDVIIQARTSLPAAALIAAAGMVDHLRLGSPEGMKRNREPAEARKATFMTWFCGVVLLLAVIMAGFGGAVAFVVTLTGALVLTAPLIAQVFNFGLAGFAGIMVTAIVTCAVLTGHALMDTSQAMAGADDSAQALLSVSQMLRDAPLLGTGLGSFEHLSLLYRLASDPAGGSFEPPAAARLAVELGMPALLVLGVVAIYLIGRLAWGALQRARDQVFPALGAAMLAAFGLTWALQPGSGGLFQLLLAALTSGLAFAQLVSRSRSG